MTIDEAAAHVGPKSWVPAGFAVGAFLTGLAMGMWVLTTIGDLKDAIKESTRAAEVDRMAIRQEVEGVRDEVRLLVRASNNSISLDEFRVWLIRLEYENKGAGLVVPEIKRVQ